MFDIDIEAGAEEMAIGAYLVDDGIDSCLVGFVARSLCSRYALTGLMYKLLQIVRIDSLSDNAHERSRSRRMGGLCLAQFIEVSLRCQEYI